MEEVREFKRKRTNDGEDETDETGDEGETGVSLCFSDAAERVSPVEAIEGGESGLVLTTPSSHGDEDERIRGEVEV